MINKLMIKKKKENKKIRIKDNKVKMLLESQNKYKWIILSFLSILSEQNNLFFLSFIIFLSDLFKPFSSSFNSSSSRQNSNVNLYENK
jgi:hypothetical protein